MQISEAAGGAPEAGAEPCRFPKLEECAHFHYERVQLPQLNIGLQTTMDQSLYSQHTTNEESAEWHMVQVTSGDECWLVQRNFENFKMLDDQLHQCIYDRKISQLPDLANVPYNSEDLEQILIAYLDRFSEIADNSINCGPVLNWFQMDNKGHRLLVPSEESRSINTPAVAAAYSVRRYVSQARDELNLEVGDMISVIDMASPGESMWWRGKRGFQVGFFPQHCVHIIGDKVPRNMPLPPPVVGSLAVSPIKPVLRKHGKLIAFFRSFILNRPSRRKLKQSGILKERVFGCDLGEHLLNSGHDIPMVLKCCAELIEEKGIVDGIYRLSGITSNIQKLRNAFDEDRIPNLHTEDILQDIHSVASLLKMYFRELPNPLCTYQLYQSFVNAVQGCSVANRNSDSDRDRLLKMREAVQKLPPPHYRTLEYLMMHLARVAKHAPRTGMTTRNVAIVWAPNLLRCAELEVGGVAALQGVGVQAVVTEFLICYADLIFCDHLPNLDQPSLNMDVSMSPKQARPKSLAISTPTKLITLEEARSKHMGSKVDECGYIEVGGGPSNLPKQYHTVIELPHGNRKRGFSKRSPLGWRSFFSKSRNSSQNAITKNRKASTPGIIIAEKSVTESDLTDMKRKLRTVKSAESLTSGHSEPANNEIDGLAPLHCLNKPPGHNRSVSHDSYFDTLQTSQNNSEGSLLDLSEIQLNFELEESEMRIFSEDESLVSSPRIHKDVGHRRILTRARPEEFSSAANSSNPSPKKQPRVILSPDSMSRKRTRLEDQLSDIQYIDCSTPDNPTVISTTAVIHSLPESFKKAAEQESYQPKNKSPRNSEVDVISNLYQVKTSNEENKRQSLNFEKSNSMTQNIPKSFTEVNIGSKGHTTTPTPQSPKYRQLVESSATTTPGFSPEVSPISESSQQAKPLVDELSKKYDIVVSPTLTKPKSPVYENVLTTISITYKSPSKIPKSPVSSPTSKENSIYEDVLVVNTEKAGIPTSSASLPVQEAVVPSPINSEKSKKPASQPNLLQQNGSDTEVLTLPEAEQRPKSLNDLEDLCKKTARKPVLEKNISTNAIFDSVSHVNTSLTEKLDSQNTVCNSETLMDSSLTQKAGSENTLSSSRSSDLNQKAMSMHATNYQSIDALESPSDFSLSEVVNSSTENLNTSQSSISFPSPTQNVSPNVSPTQLVESPDSSSHNVASTPSSTKEAPKKVRNGSQSSLLGEEPNSITESEETMNMSENKSDLTFFNISELASLAAPVQKIEPIPENLIEFSPMEPKEFEVSTPDKRKSCETEEGVDENSIYQQVKYFRRSIHEVNALLELENSSQKDDCTQDESSSSFHENLQSDTSQISAIESFDKQSKTENFPTDEGVYENVQISGTFSQNSDSLSNVEAKNEVYEAEIENYDSLEINNSHVYENLEQGNVYENVEYKKEKPKSDVPDLTSNIEVDVKSLTNKFEVTSQPPKVAVEIKQTSRTSFEDLRNKFTQDGSLKVSTKKSYDRDSLPPCLRARNLKNAVKTRSLDEEEFKKEFGINSLQRRKSLDEGMSFKGNTLPKTLNQPKKLPVSEDKLDFHLTHSTENVNLNLSEQKLNRERIEKYKEERRKFLHDKYRSESFKEDKDVLLSRLKMYKKEDDKVKVGNVKKALNEECSDDYSADSLEPLESDEAKSLNPRESFRMRAAKFEKSNNVVPLPKGPVASSPKLPPSKPKFDFKVSEKQINDCVIKDAKIGVKKDAVCDVDKNCEVLTDISSDFLRNKRKDDEFLKGDRRRRTYESTNRERELEPDRFRRTSLESRSPRKEKTSPSYCIKDMKAIFESKSQQ